MTILEAKRYIDERLIICDALNETRFFLSALTGKDWANLLAYPNEKLSDAQVNKLNEWLEKRIDDCPIQYILGEWEFMGFNFAVRSGVLIPRDDSEVLVRAAIEQAKNKAYSTALDLCCGTGCLGISLAKLSEIELCFADISDEAIALTRENLKRHGINASVLQGDLFSALEKSESVDEARFDMIISNPPYIKRSELVNLDRCVKDFEPHSALDGGEDGLDFYRRIISDAKRYLNENGTLIIEIGYDQASDLSELLSGWNELRILKDMNGHDRVIVAV